MGTHMYIAIDIWAQKYCQFILSLLYHNLRNYFYYWNKIFITTAEFNVLSSAAYKNELRYSEQKILAKI